MDECIVMWTQPTLKKFHITCDVHCKLNHVSMKIIFNFNSLETVDDRVIRTRDKVVDGNFMNGRVVGNISMEGRVAIPTVSLVFQSFHSWNS